MQLWLGPLASAMELRFVHWSVSGDHPPATTHRLFRRIAGAAAGFALLIAGLDLVGWLFGIQALIRILPLPGFDIMMPITAVSFLLAGAALAFGRPSDGSPLLRRSGRVLAVATGVLGVLLLSQDVLDVDLGIDLLLFRESVLVMSAYIPGRPPPNASLGFALTGAALYLMNVQTRRAQRSAQLLAMGVAILALQSIIGQMYAEHELSVPGSVPETSATFAPMELHTAVAFLVLSSGIFLALPDRGLVELITRRDMGGVLLRRLLPAAILVPFLVGWLRLWGEWVGLYRTGLGTSLFVTAIIASLSIVVTGNAAALSRLDASRRRAELALRDSEERFRNAYEHAPIGMALVSIDGRFLQVNRSLCGFLGYSAEELLARNIRDITYPDDLAADLRSVDQLMACEIAAYQMEKRYIRKDGEVVWGQLTASVVRCEQGIPLYCIGQVQDITERKREQLAQRLLAETRSLLASSLDPSVTVAAVAGLVVPTLADWCEIEIRGDDDPSNLSGSAAADAEKRELMEDLFRRYPLAIARRGRALERVISSGEPMFVRDVTDEMLEACAEDSLHLALLRRLALRSLIIVPLVARGRTLGAMALATAESGRRYEARDVKLAEELAARAALAVDNGQLYQASERATRVRDEVLRVVAHDLRAPLTSISLTAQLLQKQVAGPAQGRLETILRGVNHANHLIQDLLDAARMEAGQLSVTRVPEEVAPLVQECLEAQRVIAQARSIRLEGETRGELPMIQADRERILQVLSNLVGNAIKFTPEGGRILLQAESAGEAVVFRVSDTGPGIPAEDLPHLFDPFWQARAGGRDGAGLGLAIARGLVEAHGGRLWVESAPGAGSTFTFTIPIVPSMSSPSSAT